MDITFTVFLSKLKNRQPIDQDLIINIKNKLSEYLYPIGGFPFDFLRMNVGYQLHTFEENVAYIRTWIEALYSDLYTVEELNIIVTFATVQCSNQPFNLSAQELAIIQPYLNTTSNKDEVQYFLDELRYYYLGTLLYGNSSQTTLINTLITQLTPIEDQHNQLGYLLRLKKNEYQQVSFNQNT